MANMLQNTCKIKGFQKNVTTCGGGGWERGRGGGGNVNHCWPAAYMLLEPLGSISTPEGNGERKQSRTGVHVASNFVC